MSHEPIHSGHFMTSNPHTDPPPDDEDEDVEVDVVCDDEKPEETGQRKESVATDEKPVTFYKFGPQKTQSIAIDVSLNKLNKCIRVAYNKMTTPKWKDFKGLRLHWKQRIRLNNVIWRAYHMEFGRKEGRGVPILKKKSPYCYFAVPDDDTTHTKIEGTVMEGMYWKRRIEAVCAQYKRWRHFSSRRHEVHKKRRPNGCTKGLYKAREALPRSLTPKNTSTEYFDIDEYENEFTDNLFESLNQPYMFPNPRDLNEFCNSDIVQPGLLSLQPSLEEIMFSLIGDEMANDELDGEMPGPSSISFLRPTRPAAGKKGYGKGKTFPSSASSSRTGTPGPSASSPAVRPLPPPTLLSPPTPSSPLPRDPRPLSSYSPKDYQAASLLIDYSQQSSPAPRSSSSLVPPQPTRQSSLGSSPLMEPQYSTATGYVPSTQQMAVPEYRPTPLTPNNSSNFLQLLQPLQPPTTVPSNSFLVTGGDVAHMDYMPQFLQNPYASRLQASTISPSSLQSQLASIPGISSPLVPQYSLGSVLGSTVVGSRWWDSFPGSSASPSSPSVASPLVGPSTPSVIAPPHTPIKVKTTILQQRGSVVSPSSSLPRDSLTERLASRPLLDLSLARSSMGSPAPSAPLVPPSSASADKADSNPWDIEDKVIVKMEAKEEAATPGTAPRKGTKQADADSTLHPGERKRILHLHAEQSRRFALKEGFDQLMEIVPDVHSGGIKPTNAVVLAKAADFIRALQEKKDEKKRKLAEVKEQIALLNERISGLQAALPSSRRDDDNTIDHKTQLEQFFDRYTKERTKEDWRFWLMAHLLKPIVSDYASAMAGEGGCREELAQAAVDWMSSSWRVARLRPLSSDILIYLATNTRVLQEPNSLRKHIEDQVQQ